MKKGFNPLYFRLLAGLLTPGLMVQCNESPDELHINYGTWSLKVKEYCFTSYIRGSS
jgi:hypothetical protein